jgi:hypothetical protein
METENSLQRSQEPAIGPCHDHTVSSHEASTNDLSYFY